LLASINVVAQKEVIGFRRKAAVFKESEEIVILPVDVACETRAAPGQHTIYAVMKFAPVLHCTHRKF
jgi:hypothetical protein